MKLARYRDRGEVSYGAVEGDMVVPLPKLARHKGVGLPENLDSVINLETKYFEKASSILVEASKKDLEEISIPLGNLTLLPPVPLPGKIVCLGLNYRDHAAEQNAPIPEEPVIFTKPRTAIIGPAEKIVKPRTVNQLDYEAELAVVMGTTARNVPISNVQSCVFGYTILNDVSARDIQFRLKQWTKGKSFDTFAPMGPWIVTRDELKDTSNLSIRTWINQELRQNSSTRNMVFGVPEIIHDLTRVMTMEPGDIIATGTPAGVGHAFKPEPKYLQVGDKIRIEIEGVGVLENSVAAESQVDI
jgi:2-keto-4-pentenoate hydratase/2-oxohepta-3-ene-1,7-dioic acid hydratase in catechol pathway